MPPQIKRLILVFAVLTGLFIAVRFLLVPDSFGKYGHFRADAMEEVKKLDPKYAMKGECDACHPEVVRKKSESKHARVACQTCHGPLMKHTSDPTAVKPDKPRGREFCRLCHSKNAARPKTMPQVDFERHNVGMDCFLCHNAHDPRTHFKTSPSTKRWIFERDEEDERKTARRSSSYVERFFVKSDEVAAKNPALQ